MAFLIRAEDVTGLLTMDEAIDAVESGFREFGRSPELNAPRRRIRRRKVSASAFIPAGCPVSVELAYSPMLNMWRSPKTCRPTTAWADR